MLPIVIILRSIGNCWIGMNMGNGNRKRVGIRNSSCRDRVNLRKVTRGGTIWDLGLLMSLRILITGEVLLDATRLLNLNWVVSVGSNSLVRVFAGFLRILRFYTRKLKYFSSHSQSRISGFVE